MARTTVKALEERIAALEARLEIARHRGGSMMFKVRMQSKSGSVIYAAADGHPSDWVTLNNPPPEAMLATREEAEALAARVVALGYAKPTVEEVV